MKNYKIICLIILSFINASYSQTNLKIFVRGNFNFFNLTDLKSFQRELQTDLLNTGIDGKITDSYPANVGFSVGLLIPIKHAPAKEILAGAYLDFSSTGGRIHYSDYSGEIKVDQKAAAVSIGSLISFSAIKKDLFELFFDINARLIFSKFNNEFTSVIFDQRQTQSYEFSSTSFAIEPALIPSLNFNYFNVGLSVSYLIALPTTLQYNGYDGAKLLDESGDEVTIDWSGFKLGLSVKFSL